MGKTYPSKIKGTEMKKAAFIVGCLLFFLLFTADASFSGGPENPFGLGGRISYYTAKENTLGDVDGADNRAAVVEHFYQVFLHRCVNLISKLLVR